MDDSMSIYVNDPIQIEEVCVGYGDPEYRDGVYRNLYFQRYENENDYHVIDEFGTIVPGVKFHGDISTEIEKVKDLFVLVYGEDLSGNGV
jgi:hypothetical protein